ncbi:proteinaceous RNase P 2-like [Hibiscus syriacus]|uniref:proteinaceous RNase P 2-like n=1 Tax=Hibiscus syriacus TaxID=106335 RepID=UPI001921FF58|nr:proteinaceous RNase P 2-like [Hibiscus syriacus]
MFDWVRFLSEGNLSISIINVGVFIPGNVIPTGVLVLLHQAILRNGGGWHGLGWIGEGKWVVRKGNVEPNGRCCSCGDQLDCVDIGDVETEKFALSVAGLAMEREVKANFRELQDWLEKNANYEAIVDGANIGLYQQNFAEGGFSVLQLDAVVKEMYTRSGNKWPLVILHNKRVRALLGNPSSRKLVEEWMANGILYTTPHGSNDEKGLVQC